MCNEENIAKLQIEKFTKETASWAQKQKTYTAEKIDFQKNIDSKKITTLKSILLNPLQYYRLES